MRFHQFFQLGYILLHCVRRLYIRRRRDGMPGHRDPQNHPLRIHTGENFRQLLCGGRGLWQPTIETV